jgi:hypothetical protein
MKKLLVLVFIMIDFYGSRAQVLENFSISPSNPTSHDTVVVTLTIGFPWCCAKKLNGFTTQLNDTVIYHGCYFHPPNFAQMHSYIYDTVRLGIFEAGEYRLLAFRNYVYAPNDTDCLNIAFTDTLDTFFVVSPVSSVDRPLKNPLQAIVTTTQLTLTIPLPTQPTTATITDINGRLLCKEQLLNATNTLNIAELPAGLYFIAVQSTGQRWVRRFVKQ